MLNSSQVVYAGAFIPVGTLLVRAPMGVHQWDITLRGFGRYLFVSLVLEIHARIHSNLSQSFGTPKSLSGVSPCSYSKSSSYSNSLDFSLQPAYGTPHSGLHIFVSGSMSYTTFSSRFCRCFPAALERPGGTRPSHHISALTSSPSTCLAPSFVLSRISPS